ncbi:Organic cation transporter protein [Fasciolopsis buskii]|uniref:Organic cation transporter protein n=1 Tax=Fasciolopsis buskii TaxID=27845 RepID=A0A8E0S1J8_9TREM|nr:Organic cation transporter protein [Fasciolopsis buski]
MVNAVQKTIKSVSCQRCCHTCRRKEKSADIESDTNEVDDEMDPMDQALEKVVGSHGIWQWFVVLLGVIGLPTYEMFSVFGLSEQAYRCRMPEPVEAILHNLSVNEALTVLWGMNVTSRAQFPTRYPNQCYHRQTELIQLVRENQTDWSDWSADQLAKLASGQPVRCDNGYVYEPIPNQYPTSVIGSFSLSCDRSWLGPLHPTMFMIGMLIGYYVGGWSGDRFGRRATVIVWFFIFVASGFFAAFSPNVVCLCLAHLILGAADSARLTPLFVQMFEMTTARWRSLICSAWTVLQSFGTRTFTALLAYLIPEWRWLMFAMTAVGTIGIMYICLSPESPRWLVANGRIDEAVQVLERGYRYNHCCRRASKEALAKFEAKIADQICQSNAGREEQNGKLPSGFPSKLSHVIKKSTIWELFRSRVHLKRLILASVVFTCHIYSYYGIMLYGNKVRGVIYVVALVNASTALPGTMLSCILYRIFRWRKRPLLAVFALAFLSTLLGALVTLVQNTETDLFLMVAEGISLVLLEASLDMIYIYVPELFPTVFRSKSLGFCAGCSRVGAAVCSFTNELDGVLGHGSPMVFYAASIFVAMLAILVLPDTMGENLDKCPSQTDEITDL